jgi:hypothetical protein
MGIKRFEIAPASSITLAASETQKIYKGDGWNLTLNGADISDTHIHGAHAVSGICTATSLYVFEHCVFTDVTLHSGGYVHTSAIQGTLTLGNAGSYHLHNCFADSNTGVIIDFNGMGVTVLHIHGFEGKITFKNMDANHNVHCGGGGQIHTDTCTGGQIHHFGEFRYNDVDGNVTDVQSDIENDVDSILVDTAAIVPGGDATEAKQDTIIANLATVDGVADAILVDTSTTIPATITTLTTNVATVDTVVDGIQTDLSNATDGLGALKTLIDTVNTDLANGTDGLGALKALIDTVDTVVDGIQTDLSNGTDGLGALKSAIDTVDTNVDAVLVDTATTIPATIATVDANVDSILVDTATTIPASISALNDLSAAQVNAEVVDVIDTDTTVELTAPPAATSSLRVRIAWLFMLARNKITQTASLATLRNDDDDGSIATSTDSDNGTTATRGEWTP